jgi:hypothetical protein
LIDEKRDDGRARERERWNEKERVAGYFPPKS